MTILGIIPARAGSKRLPGKNKQLLAGKPLVTYLIEAALGSKLLTHVIVNSDDEDILAIAEQYRNQGIIPLRRPKDLAMDTSPAIDYVTHTIKVLGKSVDVVVILQPTSPLTLPEDIDGTIQLLFDSGADSAVSVVKLDHSIHPLKMKVMEGDLLLPFMEEETGRMAEHELPVIYVRNCSVYVSLMSVINQGRIIGEDCRGYCMPRERSVDINDKVDFAIAEYLIKNSKTIN